ncbi:MAG: CoB--CoM heterodisulfide reductase iron-sulfur subunit A family protein [Chloroflexi bacterium]|nr:CoB--CoM heterodisulfide reductase iron-sulfur subunit A family protein [Chloroflexota bacterium]
MMSDNVLVIGAGPAGLEAARTVADLGYTAVLIEKRDRVGGMPDESNYAKLTHHFRDSEEALGELAAAAIDSDNVELLTSCTVAGLTGEVGNFAATIQNGSGSKTVEAGAVILATGFQHFDPGRETQYYNYYSLPDVITIADLEGMLKVEQVVRPSTGKAPERVAFIQCVGSRDRQIGNEFCSKVCCGIASKQAIEVREQLPDSRVMIFYIDMRMYGYWENELYWPAQEKYRVNYVKGLVSEILPKGDRLLARGEDTTMGRPMEVELDLAVLSVGMEPSVGTRAMAATLNIEQNKYGYIAAGGSTGIDPVATSRPGVFVVGAASGPADLDDTFSSAGLAAARAISAIRRAK